MRVVLAPGYPKPQLGNATYQSQWVGASGRGKWIQEGRDGVGHVGIAKVRKNESQCYYMMQGPLKKIVKFYVSLNREIS